MARFRLFINLAAMVVIAFAAIALKSRSNAHHRTAGTADALAILDRHVPAVEFAGSSLQEAADALSRAAGVRIVVDPAANEVAGRVDASGISFDGITLEDDLRLLAARFSDLGYRVEGNRIRITTLAQSPPVVRIYDVRDLQRKIVPTIPAETITPSPAAWAAQTAGIFVGAGPPPPPKKLTPQDIEQAAMDYIASAIKNSVSRDDWIDAGGSTGTVEEAGGFLVIVQTAAAHRKIVELLEAIRRSDTMRWTGTPAGRKQ